MSTLKYSLLTATAYSFNEDNDCGVKAMAVATGESYEDCHTAFELVGRKHRGSSYEHMYPKVADMLGYDLKTIWRHKDSASERNLFFTGRFSYKNITPPEYSWVPKCKTPISTERNIPHNIKCIMIVQGHAIGVRDGVVHDWTKGRRHRSQYFYIITPQTQSA